MKNNIFGITNIQVWITQNLDELNKFLLKHNGNIIDIQCTYNYFHVVYQGLEQ